MIDKEMAEKYKKALKQKLIDEDNFERLEMFDEIVEEAYLAGLKEGRETKWHDLKKDPSDLPEPYATVLDEEGNRITYQGGGMWTFYSDYYEMDIEAISPVAWCKIPIRR